MCLNCKVIAVLFLLCSVIVNSQNTAKGNDVLPGEIKLYAKAIHPFFRTHAFPANLEVDVNPVAFYWPSERREYTEPLKRYDIQISKNPTFNPLEEESIGQNPSFYVTKKQLSAGKWYWRCRESDKKWSDIYAFTIGQTTRKDNRPSAQQFVNAIKGSRPRIVIRKERLPIVRKQFLANGITKEVLTDADKYFGVELPDIQWGGKFYKNGTRVFKAGKFPDDHVKSMITAPIWNGAIVNLCKAYLLTGDEKYAKEALRWGDKVTKFKIIESVLTYDGNPYPDGFCYSFFTDAVATIYDCLYDYMDVSQREVYKKNLAERLKVFYGYYCNRIENRCIDNHTWQISLGAFVRAGIIGKGDIPEADKYLTYAYDIWTAIDPEQSRTDGGWFGGGYVGVNIDVWAEVPTYFKTYTGYNYYDVPFYHNHPYYFLYRQFPGSKEDGFSGDGYGGDDVDYGEKMKLWFDVLGAELNNSVATWLADGASQKKSAKFNDFPWSRQTEGLLPGKTERGKLPVDLPQSRAFRDIGVVNMHTDLVNPKNDLHLALRSSPYGTFGHNLASHNAFNVVYQGEYLFVPFGHRHGGSKNSVACYRHTRGHNSILVDGKGQPYSPDAYGWIARFLDGKKISYACGDASNAYNAEPFEREDNAFNAAGLNREDHISLGVVKRFRRHTLLLRPSLILVYDELEANQPVQWDWVLHCRKNMLADNNVLTVDGVNAKVEVIGSTPMKAVVKDKPMFMPINVDGRGGEAAGEAYPVLGTHAYVSTISKTANQRILSFVQVGNVNAIQKISESVYQCGEWKIEAVMNANQMANLKISNKDGSATFLLKADLTGESVINEKVNGKALVLKTVDELPYSAKGLEQLSNIK